MLQDGRSGDKCGQEETRSEGGLSGAEDGWALFKDGACLREGSLRWERLGLLLSLPGPQAPSSWRRDGGWIALAKARVNT